MSGLTIKRDPRVKSKFDSYPKDIRKKMSYLRDLVLATAAENDIKEIDETLKWDEPSYKSKNGSPIRMDWKPGSPEHYAMYFNCNTSLVETFKMLFGKLFKYEKNRAIVFDVDGGIPEKELKECIRLALMYHKLKNKAFLGKLKD